MDRSIQSIGNKKSSNASRDGPMLTMVTINGSPTKPSKTGVLLDTVAKTIAARLPFTTYAISLSDVGHEFMCGLTRPDITPRGEELLRITERADLLIVGTPVFRASYTGILKHFFDLVDRDAMRERKAVLCATGGTAMHGLVIEHQLRPLMSFFSMHTITTGLYGLSGDFSDGRVTGAELSGRIARVADEVVATLAPPRAVAIEGTHS